MELSFKPIEFSIVVGYVVIMLIIGLYCRKQAQKSASSFWAASANIPIVVNSFCLLATIMSGGGMMGNIGLSANMGVMYILVCSVGVLYGLAVASKLVAEPLRASKAPTVSGFIQKRFPSKSVEIVVPLAVCITYTIYLVAQMKAAGTVGEYVLGLPYNSAMTATWVVFILYVLLGGMLAVTWTDFVQGLMMFFISLTIMLSSLAFFGGFSNIMSQATEIYPDMGQMYLPTATYAGIGIVWFGVGICSPHILMRVSTAKNPFQGAVALHGGIVVTGIFILATLVIAGPASRIAIAGQDITNNDATFLYLIDMMFGPVMKGVVGAGIYAAIMSTVAGLMIAASAAISNDIICKRRGITGKKAVNMGRIWVVIIGVIVLAFSFNPPQYLTILYSQAMNFFICVLIVPLLAGIWWKRATARGALWAAVGGGVSFFVLFFAFDMPSFTETYIALPLSLLLMIIGSYTSEEPSDEVIKLVETWHVKGSMTVTAEDYHVVEEG